MNSCILSTLIWIGIIQIFVGVHYWTIEVRKKVPEHEASFLIAFLLALTLSYVSYNSFTLFVLSIPYLGFVYWILFPLELNFLRKKDLLHLGTDSWLDRQEKKFGAGSALILKIVLAVMLSFILLDL